jgi:hypothetical protein
MPPFASATETTERDIGEDNKIGVIPYLLSAITSDQHMYDKNMKHKSSDQEL